MVLVSRSARSQTGGIPIVKFSIPVNFASLNRVRSGSKILRNESGSGKIIRIRTDPDAQHCYDLGLEKPDGPVKRGKSQYLFQQKF
jgi:hypothetical protein